MRLHYLQHVPFEGIAAIGEWAARRGHEVTGTPLYRSGFEHPGEFDMLVIMGGPMSVHMELEHPWLAEEKAFIRAAVAAGKLVLGVCLGAQLLAETLGGEVHPGEQPEIGWYPVTLTTEGVGSRVFGRLPVRFDTLHWHGDTFTLPPGARCTASSALTPNQAFEADGGRLVGLQFHLEATPESWSELIEHAGGDLEPGGEWVSSAESMLGRRALFAPNNAMLFELLDGMTAGRANR